MESTIWDDFTVTVTDIIRKLQRFELHNISSQLASNRILHNLIFVISFSISSNSLFRPKIESTNAYPLFLPIETFLPLPSRFAAFIMNFPQDSRMRLKNVQILSPLSKKPSTSFLLLFFLIRSLQSSACFRLPAIWIRSNHKSPAISTIGVAAPWRKMVQS